MTEIIQITMVRDSLANIPHHPLPDGYSIRTFKRGEERFWAEVGVAAGNFGSLQAAEERFEKEFADAIEDLEDRCFFLLHNKSMQVIGTAMAWYDPNFNGEMYGRVHWVAIVPKFQGKGLAKPMLSVVLNCLAQSYTKAVLGTQTFRKPAVNLYLDLGFRPFFKYPTCPQAWKDLANELGHPTLREFK